MQQSTKGLNIFTRVFTVPPGVTPRIYVTIPTVSFTGNFLRAWLQLDQLNRNEDWNGIINGNLAPLFNLLLVH